MHDNQPFDPNESPFSEGEILTLRGVEYFVFRCNAYGLCLFATELPDSVRNELFAAAAEAEEVLKDNEKATEFEKGT